VIGMSGAAGAADGTAFFLSSAANAAAVTAKKQKSDFMIKSV
jgi:hypothetical protein